MIVNERYFLFHAAISLCSRCFCHPTCRATLVDDLVGSNAVFLGAPVSVVGRVSCSMEIGGGAKGGQVDVPLSFYLLCPPYNETEPS
jgi:hypothetical protein